jgi:hydrogenase nickel incorporation protein HypA/HybF
MHELSIAVSIIEIAEDVVSQHDATHAESIHLRLGPLAGVAEESLRFSFTLAAAGTAAEGARLVITAGRGTELDVVGVEIDR